MFAGFNQPQHEYHLEHTSRHETVRQYQHVLYIDMRLLSGVVASPLDIDLFLPALRPIAQARGFHGFHDHHQAIGVRGSHARDSHEG